MRISKTIITRLASLPIAICRRSYCGEISGGLATQRLNLFPISFEEVKNLKAALAAWRAVVSVQAAPQRCRSSRPDLERYTGLGRVS